MINLIPSEERKKMINDFYLRLVVVFFLALGMTILIATVAILPSYFLSSVKKNLANSKLQTQKNEPAPQMGQKILSTIADLNSKLSLVEKIQGNKFFISQKVINEIILTKMSDIKITQIFFENDPLKGKRIGVNGTAPSRDRLLLFRRALEDTTLFKTVDLPISNFLKGSNIQFYFNLIPS